VEVTESHNLSVKLECLFGIFSTFEREGAMDMKKTMNFHYLEFGGIRVLFITLLLLVCKDPVLAQRSAIDNKYADLGGSGGFLGAPTTPDEKTAPDGIGHYRHYQNGSIYWTPQTGAYEVHGLIRKKWAELRWERSFLGYPITDELSTPDGVGRYNLFQHGLIYWTPQAGAKAAPKAIQNVSLVKEQSKPEVYFICGGVKLWIPSPEEFNAVGFDWAKIQVVPDGALNAYRLQNFSAPFSTIKPSDVFFDCGKDFDTISGRWHYGCLFSINLIRKNVVVAGWLTGPPFVNNMDNTGEAPRGVEDVHYNIKLDPDFIDRMYGPGGLSSLLNNARYPGNPFVPNNPLIFQDASIYGGLRGVTYNSFILPTSADDIHGELNAWHVHDRGALWTEFGWYVGRGPAPGGWRQITFGNDTNSWFPFDVMNPDAGPRSLQTGDYVIMKGALFEDNNHVPSDPWDRGATRGHACWTEMHPVDWVVRVDEPKPAYRKTVARVSELAAENTSKPLYLEIYPDFSSNPATRKYTVGEIRDLVDARFTEMSTVHQYSVVNQNTHVVMQATLTGTATNQGRFKASYIVTWRETDSRDKVWVDDAVPKGATLAGDKEAWDWTSFDVGPVFSGAVSVQASNFMGMHQHYFFGAADKLVANAGDTLFAYVYLDPTAIPYEVMLQWNEEKLLQPGERDALNWEHRAYWGSNLIDWGTDGTASRRYMGPISIVGKWVRLEVPASLVGLEGRVINGMAFTLFGGSARWDYAGKVH
jgi:hypothetical protein